MITNIIASIVVTVVTNVYAPKQYLDDSIRCAVIGCTEDHSKWVDSPPGGYLKRQERDNPDIRFVEVREIRILSFELEGRTFSTELSNRILSVKKKMRIVKTEERWKDVR